MATGHGGPAKGAGRVIAKAPPVGPDNSANTPRDGSGKFMSAKMREWREAHPEWQEKPAGPSKKELREYFMGLAPDAVDNIQRIMNDQKDSKCAEVNLKVIEHAIGRPMQAVELSGKDGGDISIGVIRRVIVDPGSNEGGAPANAPNPGHPDP